jgi:hypothetical protein
MSMDARTRELLHEALVELGFPHDPVPEPRCERRAEPRIRAERQSQARLAAPSGLRTAEVVNISLGGALLAFDEDENLSELAIGIVVPVELVVADVPHVLSLRGCVVRYTGPGEPYGLAIRFVDVDPATRARIEGILLYLLGEFFDGLRMQ